MHAQTAAYETYPDATSRVSDGKWNKSVGRRVSKNSKSGFELEDRGDFNSVEGGNETVEVARVGPTSILPWQLRGQECPRALRMRK